MKIEFKELRTEISKQDLEARTQIANDLLLEAKNSNYDFSVTIAKYKDNYENITI